MNGDWNKLIKNKTPQTYGMGSDRYAKWKELQFVLHTWSVFVGMILTNRTLLLVLDHTH